MPFAKLFSSKRIIVNVDGLEWRRAKWDGWIKQFLIFSEQMAMRFADEIITDNAGLQTYVQEEYGIDSNLIEYGADHVASVYLQPEDLHHYPFLQQPYAFKVCRIEPENNIHLVLEAFTKMPQLPLVIVGNWSHSNYGRQLLKQYQAVSHLHLLAPIYEPSKLNKLRSNCQVYIHGHSAGGTNPSLVEAMYLGLPIIAFDVIYNRVTTEFKGVYFQSVDDLTARVLQSNPHTLSELGRTMQWIAERRYTWSYIASKYAQAIRSESLQPVPALPFNIPPITSN